MKQRTISKKGNNTVLKVSKIQPDEQEFYEFIQSCIQNRETAESYILAAISEGKTRRQAIYELNSMGVFLGKLKKR